MKQKIRVVSTAFILILTLLQLTGCGYEDYKEIPIETGTIMIPNEWECVRGEDELLYIYNEAKKPVMVQYKEKRASSLYGEIELGEFKGSTTYSNSATCGTVEVKIDGEWSDRLYIDAYNLINAGLRCVRLIVTSPDVDEDQVKKIANSFSHS